MSLDELNAMLASLGPWGVFAGVVITLIAQWAKRRLKPEPLPLAEEIHEFVEPIPVQVSVGRIGDGQLLKLLMQYGPVIVQLLKEYGPQVLALLLQLGIIKTKSDKKAE